MLNEKIIYHKIKEKKKDKMYQIPFTIHTQKF